jgi:hypothetical protein
VAEESLADHIAVGKDASRYVLRTERRVFQNFFVCWTSSGNQFEGKYHDNGPDDHIQRKKAVPHLTTCAWNASIKPAKLKTKSSGGTVWH